MKESMEVQCLPKVLGTPIQYGTTFTFFLIGLEEVIFYVLFVGTVMAIKRSLIFVLNAIPIFKSP